LDQTPSVEDENAALRAELTQLRAQLEAQRASTSESMDRLKLLTEIVEKGPCHVYIIDHSLGKNVFTNGDLAETLGYSRAEIDAFPEGQFLPAIFHPEDMARFGEMLAPFFTARDGDVVTNEYQIRDRSGSYRWVLDRGVVFARNPDGGPRQLLGFVYDITEAKTREADLRASKERAEDERVAMQAQIIAMQEATIRELESPLLPIAKGVVVMPLVGEINEARALQIIENLLTGIARSQASVVILDITGVRSVDDKVATVLLQAARAARLLGTRVVLTGASPDIAIILVNLAADLSGIVTLGTLQAGIAWALKPR